mmetsp:Transcript_56890/g.151890  ORF Transcript_56890/g.151890 Transcript_56890/m.151890 type:complete len:250 (+) Transcript_56890:3869-4618(+)
MGFLLTLHPLAAQVLLHIEVDRTLDEPNLTIISRLTVLVGILLHLLTVEKFVQLTLEFEGESPGVSGMSDLAQCRSPAVSGRHSLHKYPLTHFIGCLEGGQGSKPDLPMTHEVEQDVRGDDEEHRRTRPCIRRPPGWDEHCFVVGVGGVQARGALLTSLLEHGSSSVCFRLLVKSERLPSGLKAVVEPHRIESHNHGGNQDAAWDIRHMQADPLKIFRIANLPHGGNPGLISLRRSLQCPPAVLDCSQG